ncbi:MAG: MATE family efflux transporter [Lachnospiraceae bacterium]|nr:MATE family efflux transporter [Lachnospiraceae bacterium]
MKENNKRAVDMLHGGIFKKLLYITVPIFLMSTLQQLFNASDTAVVGNFSSSEAMAAVGSNAPVINMIVTFFTGLSVGSNVMLSHFIGKDEEEKVNDALHTSFSVALISGFIMLALGQIIAVPILRLLNTPSHILPMAQMYLRIYFLGMPFLMVYDFGSAVLRSIGDTRRPLYYLIISGSLNVVLNLFFVIVLGRNADGVAYATTISNGVSAFFILRTLIKEKGMLHIDLRRLSLKWKYVRRILWIGAPAGLQGMIFSISNVVIQAAINLFGSDCVAGNSAALNVEYICYFTVYAFCQALMTFISQNYAAGQYCRCRRTTRIAFFSAIGFTAILSVSAYILRYPILSFFTHDPAVLKFAVIRMLWIALLEPMTALYEVPGASLRGIGHSLMPTIITLLGSCILRLIYMNIMMHRFTAFYQVVMIYPISWAITGATMIILYFAVTKKAYRTV